MLDERRQDELKIIAGKIGWILLVAYLVSVILSQIMWSIIKHIIFYLLWAYIVWRGMINYERLSFLETCYFRNEYKLSVLEKSFLTIIAIFVSNMFCALILFLYAQVFRNIGTMFDEGFYSGFEVFVGCGLGPLVEEWIFRGILWYKLKTYGEGFAILATTFLFAIMHGQGILLIFLLMGFFGGILICFTGNLWYCVVFHIIHNLGILQWEQRSLSFSSNMILTMLLNLGLFLISFALLLIYKRKKIIVHLCNCMKQLLGKIVLEKSRLKFFFNTSGIMLIVLWFAVPWLISLVSFGLKI